MATSRFDPQPPDRSTDQPRMAGDDDHRAPGSPPTERELLSLIGDAEDISVEYHTATLTVQLQRVYRAWRNEHSSGSKYLGIDFKGRSRIFVPKTRSAARKNQATAAAALFATEDAVSITAQFEDDPLQMATAKVIHETLNMRLSRSSRKSGIPWFQIAVGGHLDAQRTNITCSKQYWDFQEVDTSETEVVMVDETDEDGNYTGFQVEQTVPRRRVIADRPMIEIIPIENLIVDPAAPWYDPAQGGAWFAVKYPMRLVEIRAMMEQDGPDGDMGWLEVEDGALLKGRIEDQTDATRRAREGGSDRYEDQGAGTRDWDVIWIQENFVRIAGRDWHFWSVGRHALLSEVRETRESYPALDGERPYTMGFAQIDTHTVFSMSPMESWQPLQLEINDITNLRLDSLKRSIAPLPKVKRGRNVDLAQLQRRGRPEAHLLLDDLKDVEFVQTPGPSGQAYTDAAQMGAHFDELAGVFSTSSVQNNRQLNETVGGMNLMSGAANSVSEFDLRVWSETWVEPALTQTMHNIRYYESDEKILKIATAKAQVLKKFDYMPSLMDFDTTETMLKVNAGIGAADPMQKLAKIRTALEMIVPLLEDMRAQGITIKYEDLIEEIFGAAGFKEGKRFFEFDGERPDQQDPPPDLMLEMEKLKLEMKKIELDAREVAIKGHKVDADNRTKLQLESMRGETQRGLELLRIGADRERRADETEDRWKGRAADFMSERMRERSQPQ